MENENKKDFTETRARYALRKIKLLADLARGLGNLEGEGRNENPYVYLDIENMPSIKRDEYFNTFKCVIQNPNIIEEIHGIVPLKHLKLGYPHNVIASLFGYQGNYNGWVDIKYDGTEKNIRDLAETIYAGKDIYAFCRIPDNVDTFILQEKRKEETQKRVALTECDIPEKMTLERLLLTESLIQRISDLDFVRDLRIFPDSMLAYTVKCKSDYKIQNYYAGVQ